MSNDAHILDVLPALALGSLDSDEAVRAQEHLSSCLICRSELSDFESLAAQMAFAIPPVEPPPDLRNRLMERVQAPRPQPQPRPVQKVPSRSWWERLLPAWGVASLVLIIALAAFNLLLWQRFNGMDFFTTPGGLRAVPLMPANTTSRATGFVLVSADGEDGALIVDGLPPLTEDQEYQLWLLRNGEKISGAVFSTDEHYYGGTRIRAPRSLLEYSAAEITVEPTGGSSQPTGVQVLSGPLHNP
jgi:anti-sigma-K factor RskA